MKVRTAKQILRTIDSRRLRQGRIHRPATVREALRVMSRFPKVVDKMVCTPQTVHRWGYDHVITPVLIYQRFGDGGFWGTLSPMNDRPEEYLIMGDSAWAADPNSDSFRDALDRDIYPAIEDQCGSQQFYCDICNKTYAENGDRCCKDERAWPALDDEGSSWCFPVFDAQRANDYRFARAGRRWRKAWKRNAKQ